jgi:hypothetical protein
MERLFTAPWLGAQPPHLLICCESNLNWWCNLINWQLTLKHLITIKQFSLSQAISAILRCIGLLVVLRKYRVPLVPDQQIDVVLHAYLAITSASSNDSGSHHFQFWGCCFQHSPGLGTGDESDRQRWQVKFQETQALFENCFGKGTMGNSLAACCEIFCVS